MFKNPFYLLKFLLLPLNQTHFAEEHDVKRKVANQKNRFASICTRISYDVFEFMSAVRSRIKNKVAKKSCPAY